MGFTEIKHLRTCKFKPEWEKIFVHDSPHKECVQYREYVKTTQNSIKNR